MNTHTILLFAKRGQLGWELNRTLFPLGNLITADMLDADFENPDSVVKLIRQVKPAYIINPAAYTAVDQAEVEQERAAKINAVTPGIIAEEAKKGGAVLVHYSTDYVFDGTKTVAYTEDDPTNPLNVYGQSKLKGEQVIGHVGGAFVILRTSWVYSLRGNSFVSKSLKWARNQKKIKIVSDQIGSPTWARMLAEVTAAVIAQSLPSPQGYFSERCGLYHLGGSGSVSRFDFTRAVLRLDPRFEEQIVEDIEPVLTAEFPTPARRPLSTPLDCSRFEKVFGFQLPNWEESLRLAMEEYQVM
jgi:dTDP-4-dehydrorhamnose reductase